MVTKPSSTSSAGPLREGGLSRARDLGALRRAEEVAGAPELGRKPEHRHERQAGHGERPRAWVAAPEPDRIGERGRARPRAGGATLRRAIRTPAAGGPSRWRSTARSSEGDEESFRAPARDSAQEADRGEQAERRDRPGEPPAATAREARGKPEGEHDGEEAAGARETSQRAGAASPSGASTVVASTGKRLPRGAGGRVQVEAAHLAAPDEPRPGVVRGRPGGEQRQRPPPRRRPPTIQRERARAIDFYEVRPTLSSISSVAASSGPNAPSSTSGPGGRSAAEARFGAPRRRRAGTRRSPWRSTPAPGPSR